jgi:hypothetical protein
LCASELRKLVRSAEYNMNRTICAHHESTAGQLESQDNWVNRITGKK